MKNYQHDENFSMKGNSPTACSFRKAHIIRMIKVRHRECLLTQVNTFECFQSSSVQEIWMSYSATAASFIIICNQGRDACDTTQNTLNRPENKNFIWSFFLTFMYWTRIRTNKYHIFPYSLRNWKHADQIKSFLFFFLFLLQPTTK